MAEKYDVVALGEYLVDFSPSGCGKMGNPLYEMNPGGAPTNCLAACSALGGKTAIIGAVGADLFGAFLKRKAADANIDISGLQTVQMNTTLVFVSVDKTGNRELIERLLQLRPDAAHMGVCTRRKADGTRCPTIQKVADRLAAEGVVLVDGTH